MKTLQLLLFQEDMRVSKQQRHIPGGPGEGLESGGVAKQMGWSGVGDGETITIPA